MNKYINKQNLINASQKQPKKTKKKMRNCKKKKEKQQKSGHINIAENDKCKK